MLSWPGLPEWTCPGKALRSAAVDTVRPRERPLRPVPLPPHRRAAHGGGEDGSLKIGAKWQSGKVTK